MQSKLAGLKNDQHYSIFLNTIVATVFIFMVLDGLSFWGIIDPEKIENVIFSLPDTIIFLSLLTAVISLWGIGIGIEKIKPIIKHYIKKFILSFLKEANSVERG